MSINKLVSVNNVIINLLDDLGLDHNKFKPMFVNWAISAEGEIGSYYAYQRKIAVLNIEHCIAVLPSDAVYVQRALIGDFGCNCGDLFNTMCGVINADVTAGSIDSTSFLVVDLPASSTANSDVFNWGLVDHHVQDNKIIFAIDRDGQKVTVQYLGLQVDSDGIPLIGENHIDAIMEFCMWKFRRRRVRSGIDLGVARDHYNLWNQFCAEARGDDAELSESDRIKIVSMLHDPYIGKGLRLVPTPDYLGY